MKRWARVGKTEGGRVRNGKESKGGKGSGDVKNRVRDRAKDLGGGEWEQASYLQATFRLDRGSRGH